MLCAAACVILTAETVGRSILMPENADGIKRPDAIRILSKDPSSLPAGLSEKRSVLLVGNSHTYALPGLRKGDPLRPDPGETLIDRLASGVSDRIGPQIPPDVVFDRLSYPNFLPFEMITRIAHLHLLGYRPRVVVLGITWRNLARDRDLRYEIHGIYRDADTTRGILDLIRAPHVSASPSLLEAIRRERTLAEAELERERTASMADKYDRSFTSWVGHYVVQVGRSEDLRARIYRSTVNVVQQRLGRTSSNTYDLIESDLAFNLECLKSLLRLLSGAGATGVLYWAPERSDLPPMMSPERQSEVYRTIETWGREEGFVVVDARGAVPNESWGWERETPDRSHFTEPGHELLAKTVIQNTPLSVWRALLEP
jgi:hypothetical protein